VPVLGKCLNQLKTKDEFNFSLPAEESQNCAKRGMMAQLKADWRKLRGAVGARQLFQPGRLMEKEFTSLNPAIDQSFSC
jgi:hypothetical protein